jgi:hypothetical protein
MIDKYTRKPDFEIEIRRPNYTLPSYQDELVVCFGPVEGEGKSTACIGYDFNESLSSISTSFSLSLTLERDENRFTWYDKIHVRDLIFIKEHGKTRFAGFVQSRRYSARMGDKGPQRTISINGTSIGGLLESFSIIMDIHILSASKTAEAASSRFMAALASKIEVDQTMSELIKTVYKSFMDMVDQIGESPGIGVRKILDKFFDIGGKFSPNIKAKYPYVLSLYQTGENSVWDIISQIITPPFHEIYGLWNYSTGINRYELIIRPTPFDAVDWAKLPISRIPEDIPAVFLKDYDIGDSDNDTKTLYGCFLPGSAYSREKALTLDNFAYTLKFDKEKWPYYGYRPLFTELRFFNRMAGDTGSFPDVASMVATLSKQLYDWFRNNSGFLTGTVTIENVETEDYPHYPQVGERFGLLGGEFYIETSQHSWNYGGEMTTSLGLSRGFLYSDSGSQKGPIDKIGQKVGFLEADDA